MPTLIAESQTLQHGKMFVCICLKNDSRSIWSVQCRIHAMMKYNYCNPNRSFFSKLCLRSLCFYLALCMCQNMEVNKIGFFLSLGGVCQLTYSAPPLISRAEGAIKPLPLDCVCLCALCDISWTVSNRSALWNKLSCAANVSDMSIIQPNTDEFSIFSAI